MLSFEWEHSFHPDLVFSTFSRERERGRETHTSGEVQRKQFSSQCLRIRAAVRLFLVSTKVDKGKQKAHRLSLLIMRLV